MAQILVADDDDAVQQILKIMLQRGGHNVVGASDGQRALQIFREGHFDLLIVDIFMPGMDGLETMKLVHEHRPDTPIIVISGHAFPTHSTTAPDFLSLATELGAACSLQKPFKSAVLLESIMRCLERVPANSNGDVIGHAASPSSSRH
jgi:two-component system, response regulator, stage 0 sporulation protein F